MKERIIISGGGTGGHVFPAIAIANAIKQLAPDTSILFVGALGRMEMEKVPAAGYEIIGLDIQGFNRQSLLRNISLPLKISKSLRKANSVLKDFAPHVVVGVGGFASGPLLLSAKRKSIPYLIQEQNSYAGITNKYLGRSASKVCVAFKGMETFFPKERILFTGNPIRRESVDIQGKRDVAIAEFGLSNDRKTIFVTGGSLGALTLNEAVIAGLDTLVSENIQVIWQCGTYYYEKYSQDLHEKYRANIILKPFIQRMDLAYAAADLIVSRAGAGTIAELCALAKPIMLVPSPNVAEDHQTSNAKALVDQDAAILINDNDAVERLILSAVALLKDEARCKVLSKNSRAMAILNADMVIAKEVLKLAGRRTHD